LPFYILSLCHAPIRAAITADVLFMFSFLYEIKRRTKQPKIYYDIHAMRWLKKY